MDENSYLGTSSSFDLETGFSSQGKYLPPLGLPMEEARKSPMETSYLNIETSSPLDESFESLTYSEKTKSSERKEFKRTSLYRQFDPLHSSSQILDSNPEQFWDTFTHTSKLSNLYREATVDDIQQATATPGVSLFLAKNVLMSFESPKKSTTKPETFNDERISAKMYTEKEFNEILQAHELHLQGEFLRKHHDLEMSFTEKDQTQERELSQTAKTNNLLFHALSDLTSILENMSSYNKELEDKIKSTKNENEKLQKDVATSKEDLSEWESNFSDLHNRYEQCKNMIKSYKENEEVLDRNIESLRLALDEKNKMYNLLETRAQEITDKAQREIGSVKKSANAETVMLEAQLKKAEMKIYSLENVYKQVRLQNDEIGNICKDLTSKTGK